MLPAVDGLTIAGESCARHLDGADHHTTAKGEENRPPVGRIELGADD